jgi:DNA-binding CsgD family transcriptional regulator
MSTVHSQLVELIGKMASKNTGKNSLEKKPAFESLYEHPDFKVLMGYIPGMLYIFNYQTGHYEFFSNSVKTELGYEVSLFTGEQGAQFVYSILQEDHGQILVGKVMPTVLGFFAQNAGKASSTGVRFTVTLKIRNADGKYLWYLLDTNIIESDENGFPLRSVVIVTNIDATKKDDLVYYSILNKSEKGIYEPLLSATEPESKNGFELSEREIDILKLVGRGMSSVEIADELHLSKHTVNTHRKNILSKTECGNSTELIKEAMQRGLI